MVNKQTLRNIRLLATCLLTKHVLHRGPY